MNDIQAIASLTDKAQKSINVTQWFFISPLNIQHQNQPRPGSQREKKSGHHMKTANIDNVNQHKICCS